jgi:alcohol dehydrogenase
MENYQYFLPTKIIFGAGSIFQLKNIVLGFKQGKILIVSGEHLKLDGTINKLVPQFIEKPLVYNQKITKSDITTVKMLTDFCRQEDPSLIITIGGGTILDTAKSAAILAKNPGLVEDFLIKNKINHAGIPLIAVPTTSGSGSEVTPWAVIWDMKKNKKYSLSSLLMFPKVALIDPELTYNLSADITASTGMDALSQAIEAYWSKNNNLISDIFALESIKLILENLEKAVKEPNKKNRKKMSLGSLLSGLAFSNTKTTICHSVSYPITAHFNVSHGQAVALTLPIFLEYSFKAIEPERRELLLKIMGEIDVHNASQKINLLMKKIGLKTKLSELGIKKKDLDLIVREGFSMERAGNAPKIPSSKELQKILEEIL